MKKGLFLSSLALFSLALFACNNNQSGGGSNTPSGGGEIKPGENIGVLNQNGHIFTNSADLGTATPITIYKAKDLDDVPYLNAEDIKQFIKSVNDVNVSVSKNNGTVTLTKTENENCFVKFDAKNNEISFKNVGLLAESSSNTIGHDYCLTAGNVIKSSKNTKVGTTGKDEGKVTLNDYNLKLYEQNNNVYVPYDVFNVLIQPSSLIPYVYNGRDFFKDPATYNNTDITSLCYSGNGVFEYGYIENGYIAAKTYKKIEAKNGNKYTYQSVDINGKPTDELTEFALNNNGYGTIVDGKTNQEVKDAENRVTKIKYTEDNGYLTMYLYNTFADDTTNLPSEDNFTRKLVINTVETRFAKTERTQAVADFTYNLLCLSFDKVYSVKEAKKVSSFDTLFTQKGYKDNLKSTNIRTYEEAMIKFLNTEIDDGHTGAVTSSIFDYVNRAIISECNAKYPLNRTLGIDNKKNEYYSQRYAQYDFATFGIRMEAGEDTAYLSFDGFLANFGFPGSFRNYSANSDLEELRKGDTCGYMATCIMKIEEYNKDSKNTTKIKNIVVDITANGGGDMTVLPYVACIMTKDPKLCVGDSRTGQVIEYHYEADFDGDGTYGDTYADKYNFFLLTSDASFSCGSSLPSMVKGTNVKIIGIAGAGGASPITTFVDASGFVYKTSGQFGVYYKDGNDYKTIENGVPVDHEIAKELWYDYANLTKKIDELAAK